MQLGSKISLIVWIHMSVVASWVDSAEVGNDLNQSVFPTTAVPATLDPLVVSRNSIGQAQTIDPVRGNRTYTIGPETIVDQGSGQDAGFDEILLHAPGISRESSGQFHLRAEDYGIQYRLNGVQLPEGIASTLGQPFDSRLIAKATVLSGALPAEYGLRNAGVIELQSKTGSDLPGQEISMYGGSHGTIHPSLSGGGEFGRTAFYVNGTFLQNDLGTDNVTSSRTAIHDRTRQSQGFGLLTQELAPGQKLVLMLSGIDASFQIPNAPGQLPSYRYRGIQNFDSTKLDRNQREQNDFEVIAYQMTAADLTLQLAEVNSYSSTHYRPDKVGDLLFTGAASDTKRELFGAGLQFDIAYRFDLAQTLKAGFTLTAQFEHSRSNNATFPADPGNGDQLSDLPLTFRSSEHQLGVSTGFYLQHEWRLTKALTINCGGRLDSYAAYSDGQMFSPRVNLTCQLSSTAIIHAGYARIYSPPLLEFVSPATLRQYVNTTNAPDSLQDSLPRAERSHLFSLGGIYQPARGLSFGVDAYYKSVRNLQDETQLGESLIFTPFTYEHGRKLGIEFVGEYHQEAWSLYSNLAIARSEGRKINSSQGLFDKDELGFISRHYIPTDYDQLVTFSAGAAYHWSHLGLHADLLSGSGMYGGFANSEKIESHWTLNAGVTFTLLLFHNNPITARFDVKNVFDQSYLLHNAGIGATVDQYGERRGFFGGFSYYF